MPDFILDSSNPDRYTYFIAFYGKGYQKQTGLLHIQHDFGDSIETLHRLIRHRIDQVLGDTPSCYHIIALAAPEPMPCPI